MRPVVGVVGLWTLESRATTVGLLSLTGVANANDTSANATLTRNVSPNAL